MKFMSCLNKFRFNSFIPVLRSSKLVNEYDQEIPQSQTADNSMEPRERAAQLHKTPERQIKDIEILAIILVPLISTRNVQLAWGHISIWLNALANPISLEILNAIGCRLKKHRHLNVENRQFLSAYFRNR